MDIATLLLIAGGIFALAMLGLAAGMFRRRRLGKGCCGQTAEYQDERGSVTSGGCCAPYNECAERRYPADEAERTASEQASDEEPTSASEVPSRSR